MKPFGVLRTSIITLLSIFLPNIIFSGTHNPVSDSIIVISDSIFFSNTEHGKWTCINENLQVFEDTTNQFTIKNIIKPEMQEKFQALSPSYNIKYDVNYWVKLKLKRKTRNKQFIIVVQIDWDIAEMYINKNNGRYYVKKTGAKHKRPDYGFEHYNYFMLDFSENTDAVLYFRLQYTNRNPKSIELKINDLQLYKHNLNKYKLFYVSFLAVLISMIISICFIYYLFRQKVFFFYILMLIAFVGAFSIFLFYNLFQNYLYFLIAEQFFYTLAIVSFVLFTQDYFITKKKRLRLHKISNVFILAFVIIFIIHEFFVFFSVRYPYNTQNIWMATIIILIIIVYIINILSLKKSFKLSYYFLLATSISSLCGIYIILNASGVISLSTQTEAKQLFLISLIVLILFFSMSIGYVIFKISDKRGKALAANLELQKNINEKLEIQVAKRTEEITKKNELLEKQKEEILTQKEEIIEQKDSVVKHRDQIIKQKKEITDSIRYAKRIQTAVLPPQKIINEKLPNHFILFKPRDIVSGDFYWVKHIGDYILFATVDCTGHGVPGAFMSMLGTAFMNEIARRRDVTKANHFLNLLRKQVKRSLRQTGKIEETKDGMDIALCVINTKTNRLQYSGAYNPLYLIRNNKLYYIKGDKMPIGIHPKEKESFTNHEFRILKDDIIYIFSDGYIDQLGGAKSKKFMSTQFRRLLLDIHNETMTAQRDILEKTIEDWKNHPENICKTYGQMDDILIMGVKIL